MPVVRPSAAKASARLVATVDLPTPPLPEPTTTMCLTPGTADLGAGPGRPCAAACPVAGARAGDLSEGTDTITLRPCDTASAACCAATRAGPNAASIPGCTEIASATALLVTMISERPEYSASLPPPGISTAP